MGERNETRCLELVAGGVEFFEGGWWFFNAGFLEDFRVDPQPVDAVDVHRHGHVITFVLHGIGDFLVEQAVPLLRFGNVFQDIGVEQAGRRPLLNVRAFDLGHAWRVTRNGTAFQHGHGSRTATTGDCAVLPGEAVFLDLGLEDIDRCLFATRRPPMHDFHGTFGFGGKNTEGKRRQGSERNDSSEARNRIHLVVPFLLLCMQVWCLRCIGF
ncbi:hypothetical protein D3C86_1096810 [compost metagenome]